MKKKPKFLYRVTILLVRLFFKIFYRHKVYGQEHFIPGGAIIAGNHVSLYDPPILAISSPEEVHFLARESLFRSFFGRLISALNAHPIQRGTSNLRMMKIVCDLLKQGKKMIVFPEGSRSFDNKLGMIKPGVGLLISKSETAIIPAYIHGTYEVWSRHRKFPRLFGRTAVVFGTPILWKDYEDMDRRDAQEHIASRLTASIEELKEWYLSDAEGSAP